jgi:F-type H+-transporting ATPase subunit b
VSQHRGAPILAAALAALVCSGDALAAEGNIVLFPDLRMLAALVVLFLLLIYPVNALLFRPIFAALDARDERIEGTRARAEKLAEDTRTMLAQYEGRVAEVRQAAEAERKQSIEATRAEAGAETGAARADAEREIEGVRARVAGELEQARSHLRRDAEALARDAAGRVLGRPLR